MTCPTPARSANQFPVSVALTGANVINVGPGQAHTEFSTVPFMTMPPGTIINVFYRPTPYLSIIPIRWDNITLNGVTDSNGNRPTIKGAGATYPNDAISSGFYNSVFRQGYGVIYIFNGYGAANIPSGFTVKNCILKSVNKTDIYQDPAGSGPKNFVDGAAGVFANAAINLTVENNEITDCQNGVFVNSKNNDVNEQSSGLTVRGNWFHGNGRVGSFLEHNIYCETRDPIYEYNFIGELRSGALGSSLKDRSCNTIVRYNYVEGSARALDYVDTQGGVGIISADPNYNITHTYGNVFHRKTTSPGSYLFHFGTDTGTNKRLGPHYFYNNTTVYEVDPALGYKEFTAFDIEPACVVTENNNIYRVTGGPIDAAYWHRGENGGGAVLNLGTNRYQDYTVTGNSRGAASTTNDNTVTLVTNGALLDTADFFRPLTGSTTINAGSNATPPKPLNNQWLWFAKSDTRTVVGTAVDLGAYEACVTTPPPNEAPNITSANSLTAAAGAAVSFFVTATGTAPITFGGSGSLPAGFSINPTTGEVTGTAPTNVGNTSVGSTITATNGTAPNASQAFTFNFLGTGAVAPTITSPASQNAALGSTGNYTATATGTLPITFSLISPPAGWAITSAGVLTWPALSTTTIVTVQASNGTAPVATKVVTINAIPAAAAGVLYKIRLKVGAVFRWVRVRFI